MHIRICPHCYDHTGDTYEFHAPPPVRLTCDDCGSRLQPAPPAEPMSEGYLDDSIEAAGLML